MLPVPTINSGPANALPGESGSGRLGFQLGGTTQGLLKGVSLRTARHASGIQFFRPDSNPTAVMARTEIWQAVV